MVIDNHPDPVRHPDTRSTWLFVLPWPLRSGAGVDQVVINLMAQAQAHSGASPLLLIGDWSAPKVREERQEGFRALCLRVMGRPGRMDAGLQQAVQALRLVVQLVRLWRVLVRERVSVVNVHYVAPWSWSFAVLKHLGLYRGTLVLSWHGMDLRNAGRYGHADRDVFEWLSGACDANVACSQALARELRHAFPAAARPVTIRNGISLSRLAALTPATARRPERPYLLSIAAFDEKKGHDIVLRAFAAIASAHPGIDLRLVGSSGGALTGLIALAGELGITDRLTILENLPHDQAMCELAGATLFVLASRREPFGIVLLEAGYFGVPVIASRVGGIPETIRHGVNGELFRAGASAQLAWRIDGLLRDRARGERLGAALRAEVMATADWQHSYARYRSLFEDHA